MNEKEKTIRFIDLFGGIGGFRLGLEQTSDRYKCVWYCDNDKYAVKTYNKNFQENWKPRDIREIEAEEIPRFDMLCAGFPCQSFSIAGRRQGFEDTRGTMFYEILRIAQEKKPRLVFLENVKGLLNHDSGRTYKVILESLSQLGYDVEWQVLNSKNFGVPQNRKRVFIIGHFGGTGGRQVFPIGKNAEEIQGVYGEKEIISSAITTENAHTYGDNVTPRQTEQIQKAEREMIHQGVLRKGEYGDGRKKGCSFTLDQTYGRDLTVYGRKGFDSRTKGFKENKNETPALTRKMGTGGNNVPMVANCLDANMHKGVDPKGFIDKNRRNVIGNIYPSGGEAGAIHSSKGIFGTVKQGKRGGKAGVSPIHHMDRLRRLTPVECERLQGFPDNWTDGVSDTQRYKQLGNAVTVNVIEAIGGRIIECLDI